METVVSETVVSICKINDKNPDSKYSMAFLSHIPAKVLWSGVLNLWGKLLTL